jgi:hypothetical protein
MGIAIYSLVHNQLRELSQENLHELVQPARARRRAPIILEQKVETKLLFEQLDDASNDPINQVGT